MLEKNFQIRFKHYLEKTNPTTSTAYELKVERGNRFSIKTWITKQPHQLRGLLLASQPNEICYHKISDASYEQKPFDCFVMANAEAYLVIYYEKEKSTVMIEAKIIHDLLTLEVSSVTVFELLAMGALQIKV